MSKNKPVDTNFRRRLDEQAEKIEALLGLQAGSVWADMGRGVILHPDVVDALLALLPQEPAQQHNTKCTCRCNEGRHCGGCGHEGCGYTT